MIILILIESLLVSTLLYSYLHKKTRIRLKYLFVDNIGVILIAFIISSWIFHNLSQNYNWLAFLVNPALVIGTALAFTMIRFWRTPRRKIVAKDEEIVSPADGNVIYITQIERQEVPLSIKGARFSKLEELTKTDLLDKPCWLIGINMTPFDVHKNCAPINGTVILNQHFSGKFLSLKEKDALTENERNTYVIADDRCKIGVVQIASRLVRRIDSYVEVGQEVKKGDWLGMIRFGSQVDVILPQNYEIKVKLMDQIYAGTTILATPISH